MYILLILFLGLILRLISLNQSLWLDETTSALAAKMSLGDLFTKFLPGDFHPPLYYFVLNFWTKVFGYSEISLRMPSVIFGATTIYFVYLIAKKVFDEKTALIAAALSSTSGLLIYYSQEARMYSLAALLVSSSVYLFLEKKWFWFSIVLVFIGMTDYVSLLILPIFWIFAGKNVKKVVISHLPLILFFSLWSPFFITQLKSGLSISGSAWWQILGTVSFKNIALIPVKFLIGRIGFENKYLYGGVVGLVAMIYGYVILRQPLKASLYKVIWTWLAAPIFLGIVLSFKIPTLGYFRFLFCLPALYILTASGIQNIGKFKKYFLFLIFAINILSALFYILTPGFWREDWRSAAKAIGSDFVVLPAESQKEALVYYGKKNQLIYYENFNGGLHEIFLSRYVWQIFDPEDYARRKIENLGYNKVAEYDFNGVVFWKYADSN